MKWAWHSIFSLIFLDLQCNYICQFFLQTKTIISMPQPNGSVYTFGRDVNIIWRHGIPQLPPQKQPETAEKGRISIIAWGWIDMEEVWNNFSSKRCIWWMFTNLALYFHWFIFLKISDLSSTKCILAMMHWNSYFVHIHRLLNTYKEKSLSAYYIVNFSTISH